MGTFPRLRLGEFPSQGRIGRATAGPSMGDYVFVFPELDGRWGFYTSSGGDDIVPVQLAELWIGEACIEWLDESEDGAIETEFFRLRPITRSQYDRPHVLQTCLTRLGGRKASHKAGIAQWEQRLRGQ